MSNYSTEQCYWCLKLFNNLNPKTEDHCPPQGLFKKFHKYIPIVPSCSACNNKKLDKRDDNIFVAVIRAVGLHEEAYKLIDKTVRSLDSLKKHIKWKGCWYTFNKIHQPTLEIKNKKDIIPKLCDNIKYYIAGIYYHFFNERITPDDVSVACSSPKYNTFSREQVEYALIARGYDKNLKKKNPDKYLNIGNDAFICNCSIEDGILCCYNTYLN